MACPAEILPLPPPCSSAECFDAGTRCRRLFWRAYPHFPLLDGPTQSILCELVEIIEQELADVRADSRLVIEKELAPVFTGVRSDCLDAVHADFVAEAHMESEPHMSELRASVDAVQTFNGKSNE